MDNYVVVRNCYMARSKDERVKILKVERVSSLLPATGLKRTSSCDFSVSTLFKSGWTVLKKPWKIDRTLDFMWEGPLNEFKTLIAYASTYYDAKNNIEETTPYEDALVLHRERIGVYKKWTPERVSSICQQFSVKPEQLARLIEMPRGRMMNVLRGANPNGPESLWLFFLEKYVDSIRFGTEVPSLFNIPDHD